MMVQRIGPQPLAGRVKQQPSVKLFYPLMFELWHPPFESADPGAQGHRLQTRRPEILQHGMVRRQHVTQSRRVTAEALHLDI